MNLLLFIVILGVSFVVVRIGAIAFELTGLEWSLAKFQSLSCFTGTGFTTKEAELITGNPQRRRIASFIMVLGNAGLVTLIATFANSLRPSSSMLGAPIPFLDSMFPARLVPLANLIIIVLAAYVLYRVFTHAGFTGKLSQVIRERIIKKELVKPVSFEELIIATGGYGVSSIDVCKESPALDKTIAEADLRGRDITVLAIEREGEIIPNPSANRKILLGDKLMCFGKLDTIRKELCVIHDRLSKGTVK